MGASESDHSWCTLQCTLLEFVSFLSNEAKIQFNWFHVSDLRSGDSINLLDISLIRETSRIFST